MVAKVGDEVKGGDIYATIPETDLITHKLYGITIYNGKVIEVLHLDNTKLMMLS